MTLYGLLVRTEYSSKYYDHIKKKIPKTESIIGQAVVQRKIKKIILVCQE